MTRIIAGSRGGRRITVPAHGRTRPTSDRVREAAFSLIADFFGRGGDPAHIALAGISVCDLYAGSGAIGLEAASRGAGPVLLVERDRATAELARRNAADLGLAVQVRIGSVEAVVAAPPPQPFRVVWLDPPYEVATARIDRVLASLHNQGWLDSDPLVVVERSTRSEPLSWPQALPVHWSRRYGETALYLAAEEEP